MKFCLCSRALPFHYYMYIVLCCVLSYELYIKTLVKYKICQPTDLYLRDVFGKHVVIFLSRVDQSCDFFERAILLYIRATKNASWYRKVAGKHMENI